MANKADSETPKVHIIQTHEYVYKHTYTHTQLQKYQNINNMHKTYLDIQHGLTHTNDILVVKNTLVSAHERCLSVSLLHFLVTHQPTYSRCQYKCICERLQCFMVFHIFHNTRSFFVLTF